MKYYKAMVYLTQNVIDDRNPNSTVSGVPFLETQISEDFGNIKSYVDILHRSNVIKAYRIVESDDKVNWYNTSDVVYMESREPIITIGFKE